jgi:hypothetical protein
LSGCPADPKIGQAGFDLRIAVYLGYVSEFLGAFDGVLDKRRCSMSSNSCSECTTCRPVPGPTGTLSFDPQSSLVMNFFLVIGALLYMPGK